MKHMNAPWNVSPNYSSCNEYTLWNKDNNFPGDARPEIMDANARLMSAAPELLIAAKMALDLLNELGEQINNVERGRLFNAIAKAEAQS